jgi:hypothetical protein
VARAERQRVAPKNKILFLEFPRQAGKKLGDFKGGNFLSASRGVSLPAASGGGHWLFSGISDKMSSSGIV